ncbi:MAG TPA: C10 family peptidase [Candidatus Coprenecus merdipullorum]|nr:C10 family peptidase [Candidatus Coprenecus merdipullorum]
MKRFISIFIIICTVVLSSCTAVFESSDFQRENQSCSDFSTKIELEDAINTLMNFMNSDLTKVDDAGFAKEIENVICVTNPNVILTKSSDTQNPYLLYIANFKNDSGFAILSADDRLPVDIYAVADKGNVSEEEIYNENDQQISPARMVYLAASGHIPAVDTTDNDVAIDNGEQEPDDDPMPDHPDGEWVVTRWSDWITSSSVPTMLKTKWKQGEPFNDLVLPYPAGCTTIALFQIMAYNQYPNPHIVNGIEMPYAYLRNKVSVSPIDNPYANIVAEFVKHFIESVSHTQGYSQGSPYTLIYPNQAVKYFESVGYSNVKIHRNPTKFDYDKIYESLNSGYPVLVSAKANGTNGHTWVIDGYLDQFRTGSRYGAETGKYYGPAGSQSRTLVHCNWGWGGLSDGYYYAGVFATNEGPVIYDEISLQGESDGDYDSFYRIVTYEIPNEL